MIYTRRNLRRFWTRLLHDMESKRTISRGRKRKAVTLAGSWST